MRDRRVKVIVMGVVVMGIFVFATMYAGFDFGLTGYSIFGNSGQSEFDLGSYNNVWWNGSAVVLVGDNLTGSYISQIFDAGAEAVWNNISWQSNSPNLESLFCVDGGGDIYSSVDRGVNWSMTKENYGRTTSTTDMFKDENYLYILSGFNKEVWRSSDGIIWNVVNDSFSSDSFLVGISDSNNNLYVATGPGKIYKSTDSGVTWSYLSDFNAGIQDPKGIAINSSDAIYIVDGLGDVYSSTDLGVSWIKVNDGYGGSTETDGMVVDTNNYLYILLNSNVYSSTDSGVSWIKVNDDFSPYANNGFKIIIDTNDNLYVVDGVGRIFKSIDSGVSFSEIGDCNNGASNNPQGLTNFIQQSSLNVQVRSCDDSVCSGESWIDITDTSPQDLSLDNNTYFQYKVDFISPDTSVSPSLESVEINYDILNTAPVVEILFPLNGQLYLDGNFDLNFSVIDGEGNLDSCWYSLDSGVTNVSLGGCMNVTLDLADDSYSLVIYANDSLGLIASDSVGFYVDSTGVSVSIVEPTGKKSSRENIVLDFDVVGGVNCWYNVKTSIGGAVIENTTLVDCANSSFDVSSDGNYVLNLFANNSFGSFNLDSSNFSVDSSGGSVVIVNTPSGSGSGGSSSFTRASVVAKLEVENISVISLIGEERNLLASVKNVGKVSANKCNLVVSKGYERYVDSNDLSNIGVGEIVEFMFVLSVLDVDVRDLGLKVECLDNVSVEVPLNIVVWRPELDVSIVEISLRGDELVVAYNIEPTDSSTRSLFFRIFNSDGGVVAEVSEDVELVFSETYSGEVSIDISDVDEGMLKVAISDESRISFVEEDFVYGGRSITGFALFDLVKNFSYIGIILVLFLVMAGFLIFRILKLRKK